MFCFVLFFHHVNPRELVEDMSIKDVTENYKYWWNLPREAIASPYLTYEQQQRRDRMFAALLLARKELALQPECIRFDVYRNASI